MILFLLLLPLTVAADSERAIDWTRCTFDAKCLVEGKCIVAYAGNEAVKNYYNLEPFDDLIGNKCDVGLQIIPLSAHKVLMFIQVIGEELSTEKIGLYHNGTVIVGCERNDGNITVMNSTHLTKKSAPVLYEDFSHFKPNHALCAVTIDRFDKIKWEEFIKPEDLLTRLVYEPANPKPRPTTAPSGTLPPGIVQYARQESIFKTATERLKICNPEAVKAADFQEAYHVQPVRDLARWKINCDHYQTQKSGVKYNYRLFIQNKDETTKEAVELVCNSDKTFVGKSTSGDFDIEQSEFSAFCAVEISKTCKNPLSCAPSEECPKFSEGNATHDAMLECLGGKWLIYNEYYEHIQPVCKGDEMKENSGSFYMYYKDGRISKLTEGRCFQEYDCEKKTKLDISPEVAITNGTMQCTEGDMRVQHGNITYNEQKYSCNRINGTWISDNSMVIRENSRVMCIKQAPQSLEGYSTGMFGLFIFLILFSISLIPVLVACGVRCYRRRKAHIVDTTTTNLWKFMSPRDKLNHAIDIFEKASHADPTKTSSISEGLDLFKKLLDSETEDPEIWELVWPFLDRLHGSSRKRGNRLTGQLTRYLYLESKRIIDKHGWISPTRITRTQYKGYIRTVAIRLIFYCRFNATTEEVTKFIGEGFEKLRYNAVEQYPHCGALWAHVATCRHKIIPVQFIGDITRIGSGRWKDNNPMEIPEADRFPEIGDIREQAQMAIGGSLFWWAKCPPGDVVSTVRARVEKGSITVPIIDGILRSANLDMGVMFRTLFSFENFASLKSLITPEKWDGFLEKAMRIMICYGQDQAAKRLENFGLYQTDDHQTMAQYNKAKKERQNIANGVVYEETEEEIVKREKAKLNKKGEVAMEITDHTTTERFNKIDDAQHLFEKRLAKEESDIMKWLQSEMGRKALKNIKPPGSQASSEVKNEESLKGASKSEQGTASNAETTPKPNSTTENAFFSALLEEPTVIARIRTCQLTEEEKTRYKALLAKIFEEDTIIAIRVDFKLAEVLEVLAKVTDIIKTEPALIEDIPAGITVVTDIHGQLYDLDRIFKADSVKGKPGYECTKYLFLGDYVDRGKMSLEVIMALFILKILYPDRIFLLRGNHEFIDINQTYGFVEEIYSRFEMPHPGDVYVAINECFCYLSVAGIVGDKIFCAHGGISTAGFTRHELKRLQKPYCISNDEKLVYDMLWSDPVIDLKGVHFNTSRLSGIYYGEEEFVHAMENIGCKAMIRGHQVLNAGHVEAWGRLICLFTATDAENKNKGAVALVDENLKIRIRLFTPDATRYDVLKEIKSGGRPKDNGSKNGKKGKRDKKKGKKGKKSSGKKKEKRSKEKGSSSNSKDAARMKKEKRKEKERNLKKKLKELGAGISEDEPEEQTAMSQSATCSESATSGDESVQHSSDDDDGGDTVGARGCGDFVGNGELFSLGTIY